MAYYSGCYPYYDGIAIIHHGFTVTSPYGPLTGYEDITVLSGSSWANDAASRYLYEADGTTCSAQYIEITANTPNAGRTFMIKEMWQKKRGDIETTTNYVPKV